MSLLVAELQQTLDRIVAVAPETPHLKAFFEEIGQELLSGPGAGQKLDLAAASLAEAGAPLSHWTSFTLGQRAGADVRLSVMGCSLEGLRAQKSLWEVGDAFFLRIPREDPQLESWLSLKVPPEVRGLPVVVIGGEEHRVLQDWLERHFEKVRRLPEGQKFLAESLEWLLSF